MSSSVSSDVETGNNFDRPGSDIWLNQDDHIQKNINVRPDVDTSTLNLKELELTRVGRPIHLRYCKLSSRLETFLNGSKFSNAAAEMFAKKGYYRDATTGIITCFWCAFHGLVPEANMSMFDSWHKDNDEDKQCAYFSLYNKFMDGETGAQSHTEGAQNSMQLNCAAKCRWLLVDCKHLNSAAFEKFPECFMLDSPDGALCCPECKVTTTMLHFLRIS